MLRDGERRRIPGREVVVGDVVVLGEGDRVPADAVVIEATNLSADESLLTGESVPVRKTVAEGSRPLSRAGGDETYCVYSGSLIVQGQGVGLVAATGLQTEIGRIGKALQTIQPGETQLQLDLGREWSSESQLALSAWLRLWRFSTGSPTAIGLRGYLQVLRSRWRCCRRNSR